jgi:hypothetical protein
VSVVSFSGRPGHGIAIVLLAGLTEEDAREISDVLIKIFTPD